MKIRAYTAIILIGMSGSLMGCDALQALNIRKPTASLKGLKFDKITTEGATLVFDVEVDNPYPVALPLTNLDYGLTSGSKPLFSGKADVAGSIPANSSKTLSLPATIGYLDVFNAFKGLKPGLSIPYKAQLGLSMDTQATGKLRLPLEKEGELAVPTLQQLDSIDWKNKILEGLQKK
jgi:LEA14-like dessication related protein